MRAWFLAGVCVLSIGLFLRATWPLTPLEERAGFEQAISRIVAKRAENLLVVVAPPTSTSALAEIPGELRATDAVPQEPGRYRSLALVGPRGFDEPPELQYPPWKDFQRERTAFDDVDSVWLTR